jgi:6-phosphogluconolactonase
MREFGNRNELDRVLATEVVSILEDEIFSNGQARLLVSGGSTPAGMFRQLAAHTLRWSKVMLGLVDDRVVPEYHDSSNSKLLNSSFLEHLQGEKPRFLPLVQRSDQEKENFEIVSKGYADLNPPDLVLLGMGLDGHVASLFPNDPDSQKAMEFSCPDILAYTNAPAAPFRRISHTLPALLNAKKVILHITGVDKKQLLEEQRQSGYFLPVDRILSDKKLNLEVFWAP